MISKKKIKSRLPGLLALITDYITAVILLHIFKRLVISTSFVNFSFPIELSPYYTIPLVFVIAFAIFGSYRVKKVEVGHVSINRPLMILGIFYLLLLVVITYWEPTTGIPTRFLLKILFIVLVYSLIISFNRLLIHLLLTWMLKKNWINHNVLIVFHNLPEAPYFKEFLRYIEVNNLRLIGYCGTERIKEEKISDIPYLGKYSDTIEVIKDQTIDEIIIFNHSKKIKQTEKILSEINTKETIVRLAPGTLESLTAKIGSTHLTEIPVISISPQNLGIGFILSKRIFDITCSIIGLLLTALIYPIIAYKIKRSSPGPVLYKQERIGRNGEPFTMYKFRTMVVDAEMNGPQLASKGSDKRITSIGLILRRNHLDELPQFLNILKGEMSIVGPRPERSFFADQLKRETPYYRLILQVKPGLTSLGMIKYGYAHNVKEMTERLLYDVMYINNQSMVADFQIIISTIIYIIKKIFFREIPLQQTPPKSIHIQLPNED